MKLDDFLRQEFEKDEEFTYDFLFQHWMSQLKETLRRTREAQAITQSELAEKLKTTQSAVARFENDRTGGSSLRRFWEYSVELGIAPLIEFRAVEDLVKMIKKSPSIELTVYEHSRFFLDNLADSIESDVAALREEEYKSLPRQDSRIGEDWAALSSVISAASTSQGSLASQVPLRGNVIDVISTNSQGQKSQKKQVIA